MIRGVNDTYLLQTPDGERLAVRVTRCGWRDQESIETEQRILAAFSNSGLAVPRPYLNNEGRWSSAVHAPEGERYISITGWLPGASLRSSRAPTGVELLGSLLAEIHEFKVAEIEQVPILGIVEELQSFLPFVEKALHCRSEDFQLYCETLSLLQDRLMTKHFDAPYGFCHGDIHAGNALFDEKTCVSLLDFDVSGQWYQCFDVASFLWSVELFEWPEKLGELFLRGYQSTRPLNDTEFNLMPAMILARDLWHIGTWSHNVSALGCGWFFDDAFDKRIILLKKLVKKCEQIKL